MAALGTSFGNAYTFLLLAAERGNLEGGCALMEHHNHGGLFLASEWSTGFLARSPYSFCYLLCETGSGWRRRTRSSGAKRSAM